MMCKSRPSVLFRCLYLHGTLCARLFLVKCQALCLPQCCVVCSAGGAAQEASQQGSGEGAAPLDSSDTTDLLLSLAAVLQVGCSHVLCNHSRPTWGCLDSSNGMLQGSVHC